MYCLKKILFLFLLTAFIGCHETTSKTTDTESHSTDSAALPLPITVEDTSIHKPVTTRLPKGIYRVMLSSREHIIHFHPDQTYVLEVKDGNNTTRNKGDWKPTNGTIWTYRDQIVQGRYTWLGDTLAYVETQSGKLYPLQSLTTVLENNVWRNKKKEGIEFFGVGNEPFWSVEIDEQKAISFQLSDWSKPLYFKPMPPLITADSIVYTLSSDAAAIKITVLNQFCSDGMSDYLYDNKVTVLYNQQTFTGCGILYK